ncbi:MAG: 5-formyltetrahydrofolate cyclo-ligase [Alphaproteobacteria bacterium]|nr:5-formyltetrahydrofolate cyclo-ligase [Alphaproteobacteria bacterium]MBT7944118.1 5-formyltetrahydrofolate cyclo-ligase [Alphaproteobacteria bacterium]
MSVGEEKQELRRLAKGRRGGWAAAAGEGAAERLAENFMRAAAGFAPPLDSTDSIAGFWPMADEINVRALLLRLFEDGCGVALPVVVGKDAPLIFRHWQPGLALENGDFGTHHPGPDAPQVSPRIVLVPLLAFDAQGQRLGWGGGFYDRTIARLRVRGPVIAVGVAYQAQLVDSVPVGANDEPLDWMVTDTDALEIAKK